MISTAIMMLFLFDKEWSHYQYLWPSYSLLCLFVFCACYASIIVKICCGARPQHHGAARRQRKLTVTLLIMTIVSLLLWLPFAVATFVYYTNDSIRSLSYTKRMRLSMFLLLFFCTNSFVNPVVYTEECPSSAKLSFYYLPVDKDKMLLLFLFVLVKVLWVNFRLQVIAGSASDNDDFLPVLVHFQ